MRKRSTLRLFIGLLCLFAIAGCGEGGDSETNGTLILTATRTDLGGGVFGIDAEASYANTSSSGSLVNVPITIAMTAYTKDGAVLAVLSEKLSTDSDGAVFMDSFKINQRNEIIYVDVRASTGGLSRTQTVIIPSNVAMTSSPSTVAFPAASLAGATQTVAITGGLAPYSAQIDAAHISDIKVSINGSSIILTKQKNSVTGVPATQATLTVTDASGATPIAISVSYN